MKRRMLAAVLSLVMLLGLMIPAASAKDLPDIPVRVTCQQTQAQPGDEIECTVELGPVSNLQTLQLQIALPEGLTYVKDSGSMPEGLMQTLGYDNLGYDGDTHIMSGYGSGSGYTCDTDTVLLTFRCTVNADAQGTQTIGLIYLEFGDPDFTNVTDHAVVTPAQLTVVIPVTGVRLDQDSMTVKQGETQTLTATLEPGNASNQKVTFTSGNTAVATVDQDGTVHGVGEGETTITVTTQDGQFTDTCRVTVPHEHSYGTDWSHDDQYHWHECTSGDGAVADKAAHTGGTATCEQQAVCQVCGAPYGELAQHTLTHVERVEPTHFAPGNQEYWECSVCHKLFSDAKGQQEISRQDTVLPQIAHDYSDDWASDDTSHWHQCSCGDKADVAEHSFAWIIDREPTEDQTGLKHEQCTVCGYTRSQDTVIDKLDHDLTFHPAVEATCAQEGNVAYYSCANCGRNFADADATRELAHVVLPVNPDHHTGDTQVKGALAATCTQDGYTGDTYCTGCNELLQSGTVIPATGHSLERVEGLEATHAAAGHIEYWRCAACGALFADEAEKQPISLEDTVIPQIPHSFGTGWASDSTGHWHECSCGAKSDVEGHSFGNWTVTRQPTQTDTGSRERVCTVCGYVETQTLAVLAPVENGGSGNGGQGQTADQPSGDRTSADGTDGQSKTASPKTGDESLMGIGLGTLALAGVGLTILTVTGRKRREDR